LALTKPFKWFFVFAFECHSCWCLVMEEQEDFC